MRMCVLLHRLNNIAMRFNVLTYKDNKNVQAVMPTRYDVGVDNSCYSSFNPLIFMDYTNYYSILTVLVEFEQARINAIKCIEAVLGKQIAKNSEDSSGNTVCDLCTALSTTIERANGFDAAEFVGNKKGGEQ